MCRTPVSRRTARRRPHYRGGRTAWQSNSAKRVCTSACVSAGPIDTEMAPGADEYKGKLYPPSLVADAIVAGVGEGRVHQTAPRKFGAASAMYPIMGRPFRWGIRKFTAAPSRARRTTRAVRCAQL